jgi:hypothetical protein
MAGSRSKKAASEDKRRELMWELHQLVTEALIAQLKDPDSVVRGTTFAVAIQFLKDNNITVSSKDATSRELEKALESLSDLPFA